jgi:hypothetical protein
MTSLWSSIEKDVSWGDCLRCKIELLEICPQELHYEKLCLLQPCCLATKVPKQLIYNYTTTIPWKYKEPIKEIPC